LSIPKQWMEKRRERKKEFLPNAKPRGVDELSSSKKAKGSLVSSVQLVGGKKGRKEKKKRRIEENKEKKTSRGAFPKRRGPVRWGGQRTGASAFCRREEKRRAVFLPDGEKGEGDPNKKQSRPPGNRRHQRRSLSL